MTIKCPFCSELIQADAKKCRYCGEWLESDKKTTLSKKTSSPLKYYLLWLGNILLFFLILFLLGLNQISTTLAFILAGLCVIFGVFLLIKLCIKVIKTRSVKTVIVYVLLVLASYLLYRFLLTLEPPVTNPLLISQDEAGLRKTVEKINQLYNQGDSGLKSVYKDYLSSSYKSSISETDYINMVNIQNKADLILATKVTINGVSIDGLQGYVDRTIFNCTDKDCKNISGKSRIFKKYIFENSKWRLADNQPTFCPRTQMYDMEPEFVRALSLLSQRAAQDFSDQNSLNEFKQMLNCVDVKYAGSDAEMENAEGMFRFVPEQSALKLTILVSPRYKVQDDIITAALLTHEYVHAMTYVYDLQSGKTTNCYLNEALAFEMQNRFLLLLNPEETRSIIARLTTNPSPELRGIAYTWTAIQTYKGETYTDRALNYVKSSPLYQAECGSK